MIKRTLWYLGVNMASGAKVGSWMLLVAVAFAPLPFGSSQPVAVAFWCIVLGLGLIATPPKRLRAPDLALLGGGVIIVASYAVVLHEQLTSVPWLSVTSTHPLWAAASEALGTYLAPSASIARNQPYLALGSPLVCMLALICGFLVGSEQEQSRRLLWVIAASGAIYAAYGIAAQLIDPTEVLWRPKPAYIDNVTATFINRNTAAVYFGSCAVVCLMLLCERLKHVLAHRTWNPQFGALSNIHRDVIVLAGMLFVCLVANFMTGSRAGSLLSLLALIFACVIYFHRDLSRRFGIAIAVLCGAVLALVLLQFMGGDVNARFDAQGFADEGRFATWRATLRMIAEHPWLGTGQGTFAWSFPAYRSADVTMWGTWDHAHNTLLELAAEMGIPLACLVIIGWVAIFGILIHGVRVRRRNLILPASSLAVAALGVAHSLLDFSLQIAGYSIPVLALVGAGLAQSFSSDRGQADRGFERHAVTSLPSHLLPQGELERLG